MAENAFVEVEPEEFDNGEPQPKTSQEKQWRLSYLRSQFDSHDLNDLYKPYTDKISHGYFSLFLILEFCLNVTHFVVLLVSNYNANGLFSTVSPDLYLYAVISFLSVIGIFTIDSFIRKFRNLMYLSCFSFAVIVFMNFFVPIYHELSNNGHFRPAYTTHLLLFCYMFLNIQNHLYAIIIGTIITITHLLTLYLVVYSNNNDDILWRRIVSDMLYFVCINALGINFRYLNEIVKRRSFLDRRECISSKYQINNEQVQEDTLLSSIIPPSIIEKVKNHHLENIDTIKKKRYVTFKPFDKSLLEQHTNVTILFADIVNYTEMTTKLHIIDLLNTLNELFGSFDDASEVLQVTRIKFLGDCYYCVSGLPPNPAPNHAEACVNLGLQMISIIAEVREKRQLNINMRIGIHTGKLISGIIGQVKYQFDIWSKDVDIANKMETEGEAGKVHITGQTRELLGKSYDMDIEPTSKGETVPFFYQNGIKTYLVAPNKQERVTVDAKVEKKSETNESAPNAPRPSIYKKRASGNTTNNNNNKGGSTYLYQLRKSIDQDSPSTSSEILEEIPEGKVSIQSNKRRPSNMNSFKRSSRYSRGVQRRTAFMNTNIKRHVEMSKQVNEEMENTIQELSFSKYRQFFKIQEINNLLCFRSYSQESNYLKQPDPLFKFYLLSNLLVLVCTFLIQNLTLVQWNWESWEFYVTFFLIFLLIPFTWTYFLWSRYVYPWMKDEVPKKRMLKFFYNSSQFISNTFWARLLIYSVVIVVFSSYILSEIIQCEVESPRNRREFFKDSLLTLLVDQFHSRGRADEPLTKKCAIPWHMTETCSLAIIMAFLFIRTSIWIKFLYASIITIIYSYCVSSFSNDFYEGDETFNYGLKPQYAHILAITFLTFTLHLIDRQTDYMNRLDYLTGETLKESKARVKDLHMINKQLLNNILPEHVAEKYLDLDRDNNDEVYHEFHPNVAVMFASIIFNEENKDEAVDETEILTLFNTYISDYDRILRSEEFNGKIEKIKMSKWTYMAVCGLNPKNTTEVEVHASSSPIIILLAFATQIMKQTKNLSEKETYNNIKLRIGIAHGPILAGVVGSKKPLYDVWGDPVNMASRMETTGTVDRIQIIGDTADMVEKYGYELEYRGERYVKGRPNLVPTYFVKLSDNYELIKKHTNCN